jgi:hypothetical protein
LPLFTNVGEEEFSEVRTTCSTGTGKDDSFGGCAGAGVT